LAEVRRGFADRVTLLAVHMPDDRDLLGMDVCRVARASWITASQILTPEGSDR
jgi:hypothetical protein